MTPEQFLAHHDEARLWPGPSGLDLAAAYERALSVRQLRMARGERPRGYKIGFTNRQIWQRYNVFEPIWGTVWDTTLALCEGTGDVSLAGLCQPRLEPECVIGLRETPPAQPTLDDLLACIEWIAPGFEIVHTHLAGWKFTAADTVADAGLHGRLLVGPRVAASEVGSDAAAFTARLAASRVVLRRGPERIDEGCGANVLDSPLHALRYFLQALRNCPGWPDLQSGDVVTTGTWTDAWPVAVGETWTAAFEAPLAPLELRLR
jgi:2-keto-4-pentenoate hydratase